MCNFNEFLQPLAHFLFLGKKGTMENVEREEGTWK